MIKARCKLVVQTVKHWQHGSREVELATQYDKSLPEDLSFSKATPNGSMKISIDNPAVFDLFTPGREVYVDITSVE